MSGDTALGVFRSLLSNLKANQLKADATEEKAQARYGMLRKSKLGSLKAAQDMAGRKKVMHQIQVKCEYVEIICLI